LLAPLVTHNAFLGQMPNDALVDRILALTTDVTPSERLVLKIAAALIKQLNEDNYEIQRDSDPRIKSSAKEFDMVPDCFEMWNGIPRPKHWSTPERMAAIEKRNARSVNSRNNSTVTAIWPCKNTSGGSLSGAGADRTYRQSREPLVP
jgi:hypothetical protein